MSDNEITIPQEEKQTVEVSMKTLIKTLEAIDWKLWELYQTAKRVEKHLGIDKNVENEK